MSARQQMRDHMFLVALRGYFAERGVEVDPLPNLIRHLCSLDEETREVIIRPAWQAASNRAGIRHTRKVNLLGGKLLCAVPGGVE